MSYESYAGYADFQTSFIPVGQPAKHIPGKMSFTESPCKCRSGHGFENEPCTMVEMGQPKDNIYCDTCKLVGGKNVWTRLELVVAVANGIRTTVHQQPVEKQLKNRSQDKRQDMSRVAEKPCGVPGCKNKIRSKKPNVKYCRLCGITVSSRKRRYKKRHGEPAPIEFLHAPVNKNYVNSRFCAT